MNVGMKLSRKQAVEMGLVDPTQTPGKKHKPKILGSSEALFDAACQSHGLPVPVREYRFHPTRKWRFDFLFDCNVAVEVQGGLFSGGRHVRGAALLQEYDKINSAQIMGFIVLMVTPQQVENGEMFELVKRALKGS